MQLNLYFLYIYLKWLHTLKPVLGTWPADGTIQQANKQASMMQNPVIKKIVPDAHNYARMQFSPHERCKAKFSYKLQSTVQIQRPSEKTQNRP